jgi:hypothetical protein
MSAIDFVETQDSNRTPSPSISAELPRSDGQKGQGRAADAAQEGINFMNTAAARLVTMAQGNCSSAVTDSLDYGLKMMEAARASLTEAMDLANALMAAKAPSEVIEITSAHARRQLDILVDQNRRLWTAAQKIAKGMMEPLSTTLPKRPE